MSTRTETLVANVRAFRDGFSIVMLNLQTKSLESKEVKDT